MGVASHVNCKNKADNLMKQTSMKQLFRLNFGVQAILLIALAFSGCTNKSTDYAVDLKINGQYEVNFYNNQKTLTSINKTGYSHPVHTDIKSTDIQNYKKVKEIQRIDNQASLTITYDPKPDSINKFYSIKSTVTIDTVIFNGSHKLLKKEDIEQAVSGHSKHEITEIINKKDTLNWIVTTTLNYNLSGQVKGKSNDLLVHYLIEKELSDNYIPEILKTIKDKK